jgi:hypothetical protein
MCNVSYAIMAEGRNQEEIEELDAAIGMIEGPEQKAMDALNELRMEQGLPPLEAPHD